MKPAIVIPKLPKASKAEKRKDWALELLRSNLELILKDFEDRKEINSTKVFRNYFWQKLILKRRPNFLENFLRTHLMLQIHPLDLSAR